MCMLWYVQGEAPGGHAQGSAVTWFRFNRTLWLLHGESVMREWMWKKKVEILVIFNHWLPKVPTWDDWTCGAATQRMVNHGGEKFWEGVRPTLNSIWGPSGTSKTYRMHNSRGTLHSSVNYRCIIWQCGQPLLELCNCQSWNILPPLTLHSTDRRQTIGKQDTFKWHSCCKENKLPTL